MGLRCFQVGEHKEIWGEEGMEVQLPFPMPSHRHLFQLAVPELHPFIFLKN